MLLVGIRYERAIRVFLILLKVLEYVTYIYRVCHDLWTLL